MSQSYCTVRQAKSLEEVHDVWWPLMQKLGWNRAEEDAQTHYSSSGPQGWFVVTSDDDPKETPLGCIAAFAYPNRTGWIGFFCVQEEHRGKGWGGTLFGAGLRQLTSDGIRTVGLDAVKDQVPTYERRGFVDKARIKIMVRAGADVLPPTGPLERPPQTGEEVVPIADIPSRILVQSDLEHTGLRRERLWSRKVMFERNDGARGFALINRGGENGDQLLGWILVRSCPDGYRVGPFYASSVAFARYLLDLIVTRMEDKTGNVTAEVWSRNPEAVKLFEQAGWKDSGVEYHRMWLDGNVPKEQAPGGLAETQMFAVFDAGEG